MTRIVAGTAAGARRACPALSRIGALNVVFAVARRMGRLDAADALSDLTAAALRRARAIAIELDCCLDDLDDATIVGLEAGRGAWPRDLSFLQSLPHAPPRTHDDDPPP